MKFFNFLYAVAALVQTSHACFSEHIARAAREASQSNDCVAQAIPPSKTFAITGAQVFDGSKFNSQQTVLITGNKIVTVGGAVPPGIQTINGSGKFLIPGLIDSHVHPQSCGDLGELAAYGITTAINMACLNYTVCAQLKGQLGTADYITAGEIACGTGSVHATFFGVPAEDTIGPNTDLNLLVDHTFGNGSDFLKIVAEDNGPTVEQQSTMVQLAHQHQSLAVTHATLMEYYYQAIQSKTDGIQHCPADGLLSTTQINQIHAQGQFAIPTMELYRFVFASPALTAEFGFNSTSNYSNIKQNVANLHKAGIPIAAGTDAVGDFAGILNYPFGRSLHCELQNLVDAGFSNAEVLSAATTGASKLYRLNDRGSISTGMRADLLLLGSNPIENITNTLDIQMAWAGGIQIGSINAKKGQSCDPASLAS